jgi:5-(carboxyamino)imidazole ribonucleotide synthase
MAAGANGNRAAGSIIVSDSPVLPGSTIGVLGSGQLGRMFAIAARRMGYRVHTFSPDEDTPTGQVADLEITAAYQDLDAVCRFARDVSVVTFEFENVPAATAEAAARCAPVRPAGHILHTTQHRLREKTFLTNAGLPLTPFRRVASRDELDTAANELGLPAILKTADFGYDGKGQFRITDRTQFDEAWNAVGQTEAVLEAMIDFEREISVVAARSVSGDFVHYGAIENHHVNGILDTSVSPAGVSPAIAADAVEIARAVLQTLEVVGVLCTEFFVTRSGRLLINELAPRPHNSGHFTFDANLTSQFEQQLRAVCLLPLGAVTQWAPAAMVNLLGDIWSEGEPNWAAAAAQEDEKLHLYGKLKPRAGRKMGHLTAMARTAEQARTDAIRARDLLVRNAPSR